MAHSRSLAVAGLFLGMLVVQSLYTGPVSAGGQRVPGSPMDVTTDTPEYCLHLLDRLSEMVRLSAVPVPSDVTSLSSEGERLCYHGQAKGGVLRLRRALLLMEHGDGAAYR